MTTVWWESDDARQIDFTNPEASEWYSLKLRRILREVGVDGFKFDAGETDYVAQVIRYFSVLSAWLIATFCSPGFTHTLTRNWFPTFWLKSTSRLCPSFLIWLKLGLLSGNKWYYFISWFLIVKTVVNKYQMLWDKKGVFAPFNKVIFSLCSRKLGFFKGSEIILALSQSETCIDFEANFLC